MELKRFIAVLLYFGLTEYCSAGEFTGFIIDLLSNKVIDLYIVSCKYSSV